MDCYNGITIPDPILPPCGGEYVSTECVATPTAIPNLDIEAGATQSQINAAITNALLYKEQQIDAIIANVLPFVERKIFRGSFLGSSIIATAEDTINDITIANLSTGIYEISSALFSMTTVVYVVPNSVSAGYEEITISYLYTNATSGTIVFKVRNNGTLVNLLESPIKIEI